MNLHENPEQLSAYIDGRLNDVERAAVEDHLPGCSECREIVGALRATVAEMRALEEPIPERSAQLRGAIARARGRGARVGKWSAAIAGTAAAIVGIVALSLNNGDRSSLFSSSPETAAMTTADIVTVEPVDFTEETATQLLAGTWSSGGSTYAQEDMAAKSTRALNRSGAASDFEGAITRCHDQAFGGTSPAPEMQRAVVASFKGTPAFLVVYRTQTGRAPGSELWVFRQSDCFVLYFTQ